LAKIKYNFECWGNCLNKGRGWRRSCVYIATTVVLVMQREDLIIMLGDDDVLVNNYGTGLLQIDESAL